MDDRLARCLLVAAAWACLAGGALHAQPPADAETSLIAPALSPSSSPTAFDGINPATYSYVVSPPGWFVQAEADVVKPHIIGLSMGDPFQPYYDPPLRAADLNWGGAGALGVGYRTADANGFLLSFRGGSWTGQQQGREAYSPAGPGSDAWEGGSTGQAPNDGAPWTRELHSRLSFGRLDLDYLGSGWPVADSARIGWSVGLRGAWMTADFTADDSFGIFQRTVVPFTGAVLSQQPLQVFEHKRATLSVATGGLHFATDGTWALGQTGLGLFAGMDCGLLLGRENGHFSQAASHPGDGLDPRTSESGTALLATFNANAGVQYVVAWRRGSLRLSAGYQFEAWWFAHLRSAGGGGSFLSVAPSESGPLFDGFSWDSNGLFLRSEFVF